MMASRQDTDNKESCSILLLKEPPGQDSDNEHEQHGRPHDPYRTALQALAKPNVKTTVDYLAPMTTLFPESTLLSRAIAAGYPNAHRSREEWGASATSSKSVQEPDAGKSCLWAFAVTSQNAVHAMEEALQRQDDPTIREAWLQIPVFSLTGATLASVKRIGFKTINNAVPTSPTASTITTSTSTPTPTGLNSLSFDNAAQLVDFLVSLEWPKASDAALPPPELWFLTGKTRMKTLAEKLSAHKKPFQEVVIYETGQRPAFEEEFSRWLQDSSLCSSSRSASLSDQAASISSSARTAEAKIENKTIWLAGFSPRGVDIAVPTLKRFLSERAENGSSSYHLPMEGRVKVEIRWAAIGPTTAKRIHEHLVGVLGVPRAPDVEDADKKDTSAQPREQEHRQEREWDAILSPTVAVAKAPKPDALAEVILS